MLYLKMSSLFCLMAMLLAITANGIFFLVGRLAGGAAIVATYRGWIILVGIWWGVSFLLGLWVATSLRLFPFTGFQ